MFKRYCIAAAVLFLVSVAHAANSGAANLVLNPGFEDGGPGLISSIPEWDDGILTFASGAGLGPHSGFENAFFTRPFQLGFLSQVIPTVVGQEYNFSFWVAAGQRDAPNQFVALWGITPVLDLVNNRDTDWVLYSFSQIATATDTRITFGGRAAISSVRLDDVSVVAVPEPGAYMMLVAGLLLLGFVMRRRIKVAARLR